MKASSAVEQCDGFDWTWPSVLASDYRFAGCLLCGGFLFLKRKVKLIGTQLLEKKTVLLKSLAQSQKTFWIHWGVQRCRVTQNSVLGEFAPAFRDVWEKIPRDICKIWTWLRIANFGIKEFCFRLQSLWNTPSCSHCFV